MKSYLLGALTVCCLGLSAPAANAVSTTVENPMRDVMVMKKGNILAPKIVEAQRYQYYYTDDYYTPGYYYSTPTYYYRDGKRYRSNWDRGHRGYKHNYHRGHGHHYKGSHKGQHHKGHHGHGHHGGKHK